MGLKSILREIKRSLTFWRRIESPPSWVWKAYYRWKHRLPHEPYDMRKHFVGRHFIYRVEHGAMQGVAPIIGWYKKKRIKK